MSLRCSLGVHDWRYDYGRDPTPEELMQDTRLLRLLVQRCQRCHASRTAALHATKETYVPPEGLEMSYTWPDGTTHTPALDAEEASLTCVRPGTRFHGTKRDGTVVVNTACGHHYKDHGSLRYYGDGRSDFAPGKCRDCSCEGFLG